jgi:hypothetical protein
MQQLPSLPPSIGLIAVTEFLTIRARKPDPFI